MDRKHCLRRSEALGHAEKQHQFGGLSEQRLDHDLRAARDSPRGERWQNGDLSYSNLRVNSSEAALKAYRQGVADSYWLDSPVFTEKKKGDKQ